MKLTGRGAEVSEGGGGSSMTIFEAFCVSRSLALKIYTHKQKDAQRERERERGLGSSVDLALDVKLERGGRGNLPPNEMFGIHGHQIYQLPDGAITHA
jgi:hypothetical protein